MSSDGRARKRNLLSGGPKCATTRSKATAPITNDSCSSTTSVASTVESSLASSKPTTSTTKQGRQTRQSTLSQRTLEPFAFTQTRSTAKPKTVNLVEDDDDEIQIIEEPQPKRSKRRKSDTKDSDVSLLAPDSLAVPSTSKKSERQGTPFTSIQSRKEKRSVPREVIPDSIAELDEAEENSSKRYQFKRTQNQAGLDDGLGEALKAVKKIKLSPTPVANDLSNISMQASIRSLPPGKRFQKARQGSFYFSRPSQIISVAEMSTWNGK